MKDAFQRDMTLVVIESPYAAAGGCGSVEGNLTYLRVCMRHCLLQDEAPFASHALYTQDNVLDDDIDEERNLGIAAGFAWGEKADKRVVYTDFGITPGMESGIEHARSVDQTVEKRTLDVTQSEHIVSDIKDQK
jgi:hypothetical protein